MAFKPVLGMENLQVNHKDENHSNNNIDNLEWCTRNYNINYGTRIERTYVPVVMLTLKDEIIKTVKELKDFDEDKFELDKKQVILSIILREENIGSTVMPFVNNIVMYNCDYPDSVEQVMSYTYDDFVKTIKEIDFSNYSVGVIKNKE